MTIEHFRTHKGRIVQGVELREALAAVANDLIASAYAVRGQDLYAAHVTENDKAVILEKSLIQAEEIRAGRAGGFWLWQRLNEKLTGECVSFLSK